MKQKHQALKLTSSKKHRIFDEAFDAGVKKLIKLTENHMNKKPNIRLSIGFKYTVIKIEIDADAPAFEEVTEVTTTRKQAFVQQN